MVKQYLQVLGGTLLAGALGACAHLDTQTETESLSAMVQARTGADLHQRLDEADTQRIHAAVQSRLKQPLTADAAVQVALLANPQAQRLLDQLDLAVAERVQASLLANPLLEFALLEPRDAGRTGLEYGLGFELLGALTLPVRQRIAAADYAARKLALAEALVGLAAQTRKAYYTVQTAERARRYWEDIREAAEASSTLAERLYRAGNVSALKRHRQQLFAADVVLQAEQAQVAAQQMREKLNRLMGLWGTAIHWELAGNLPALPESAPDTTELETQALEASLRLQATRARLDAQAERLGLARNTRFLPELDAGYVWEREVGDGARNRGPTLGVQLPLFDTGAARGQKLRAEFRLLERDYVADALAIRAETRSLSLQLTTRLRAAQQAQRILDPRAQALIRESVLHFNAMQIGLFELLQDRRR